VYLIYLTACESPVYNIEYAADWRLVADPVLNASAMARLYINCWILEGDSETASCDDTRDIIETRSPTTQKSIEPS
jgi:hypothetical protein